MNKIGWLLFCATGILVLATVVLVIWPYQQLSRVEPESGLRAYTISQSAGRKQYVSLGCVYCHSQQPRDRSVAPDHARGWGRASTPADYAYDYPHVLGTMRTGPDLLNIGARQSSKEWHLTHLYQPRAVVPWSIMPAYPFLFETKSSAADGDVVVQIPEANAPPDGSVVVARQEALDLVAYLLSLDRTYKSDYLEVEEERK